MGLRRDPSRMVPPLADEKPSRRSASSLRGLRLLSGGIFNVAKMRATANQTFVSGTMAKVAFDTAHYDTPADDAPGQDDAIMADVAADRLVIRQAGVYTIVGGVKWQADSDYGWVTLQLKDGSGNVLDEESRPTIQSVAFGTTHGIVLSESFAAGDVIELHAQINRTGTQLNSLAANGLPFLAAAWHGLYSGVAGGAAGAPVDAEYLVKTVHAELTNEEVVGPTPGGELGGTWPAPTVDSVHSGSAHHPEIHTHPELTDHGGLGGLTDPDHPQYGLLNAEEVMLKAWLCAQGFKMFRLTFEPGAPPENQLHLYSIASGSNIILRAKGPTGATCDICTLPNVAVPHVNSLTLNWIKAP